MKLLTLAFGLSLCLCMVSQPLLATDKWQFSERTAVTGPNQPGVFHHMEGAGRKHIAVSGDTVAVTWEDNQTSDPQVYVAFKQADTSAFSKATLVSTGTEAYEPAIVALGDSRFVLAWEQDGSVFARTLFSATLGEPLKLSTATAGHISLGYHNDKIFSVWREQQGRDWTLHVSQLALEKSNALSIVSTHPVEAKKLNTPVLFPTIAINSAGLCVAWEDRRAGHTRLMFSYSKDDAQTFSEPESLNEFYSGRNEYDKGNGVTRVAISSFGDDEIVAAWMDKRRSAGYGIFAALGSDGGETFGPNEKVHGKLGDEKPHYNPAVAGNQRGDFVITWDDYRIENADIWISTYSEDDDAWSKNYTPPPASGPMEQSHPSVALGDKGELHLVWVERKDLNGVTRLWYSQAKPVEE